jgi:hypothetical protein
VTQHAFSTNANPLEGTLQFATTPRYLAGGGDPRRVTEVLRAAGWRDHSARGYPHVLLASPDMATRLALEPSAPDPYAAWWRFNSSTWYARFGGNIPVEILAGFCDALVQPGPDRPPAPCDIRAVLASTSWSTDGAREGVESAVSPDGCVRMSPHPHPGTDEETEQPAWSAEATLSTGAGGRARWWSAWFSHGTPTALVAGFAEQLVSRAPVYRSSFGLPHPRLLAQEPTPVHGKQLAADHRQRLARVRAASRKQRKNAAAPAARAPAVPAAADTTAAARR